MTEKELEQLFKEKLENRQFEFNPSNWERMEDMLDLKSTEGGGFFWGSTAAIAIFGLLVSGIIYLQKPMVPTSPEPQNYTVEDSPGIPEQLIIPEEDISNIQNEIIDKAAVITEALNEEAEHPQTLSESRDQLTVNSGMTNSGESPAIENIVEANVAFTDMLELNSKIPLFRNVPAIQSSQLSAPVTFTPEALRKYQSQNEFYISGGAIFSGSYNSNNPGVGWQAGIGYQRRICEKFLFNLSLNYTVQNDVGIINNTDSVFYTFGKETIETKVDNRRLDYIEMPFSLGYAFNEKHSINTGGYISMLTSVNREINRKTYATKRAPEENIRESRGYEDEFNRLDFGMQLGYEYSISPDLKVGLSFKQGLSDITKNIGGEYKRKHSNRSTRIVFRYNLFKK